jgi:hypothetical protein
LGLFYTKNGGKMNNQNYEHTSGQEQFIKTTKYYDLVASNTIKHCKSKFFNSKINTILRYLLLPLAILCPILLLSSTAADNAGSEGLFIFLMLLLIPTFLVFLASFFVISPLMICAVIDIFRIAKREDIAPIKYFLLSVGMIFVLPVMTYIVLPLIVKPRMKPFSAENEAETVKKIGSRIEKLFLAATAAGAIYGGVMVIMSIAAIFMTDAAIKGANNWSSQYDAANATKTETWRIDGDGNKIDRID